MFVCYSEKNEKSKTVADLHVQPDTESKTTTTTTATTYYKAHVELGPQVHDGWMTSAAKSL